MGLACPWLNWAGDRGSWVAAIATAGLSASLAGQYMGLAGIEKAG